MKNSNTVKLIQQITLGILIAMILCVPGRAELIAGPPPPEPEGACCLNDGTCIFVTQTLCDINDGIYQGNDIKCIDASCAPLGACCIPFDMCVVSTISECFGELGGVIWAPEQDCNSFICPPLGACCKPDGTCQVTSQSACANVFEGTYQGDGLLCKDVACGQLCPADLDNNGVVNTNDLLLLFGAWGPNPGHSADLDGSGTVDVTDLLILFSNWGLC